VTETTSASANNADAAQVVDATAGGASPVEPDAREDLREGDPATSAAAAAAGDANADEKPLSDEMAVEEGDQSRSPAASRGTAELFHESEIAADYVEGLLDILDYDGDIDELVVAGRPVVEVVEGGDGSARRLNALVGARGVTLEALQELARLAVFRQTGTPSRLLLDVAGYRAARRKELGAMAKNAAEKVKEYGEPVRMEPMSAFERKCVHDVINALAGVESESEGTEPSRRVVVRPVG
jgi:spoIIIJ-associated protein